jgi:hypothetical protein
VDFRRLRLWLWLVFSFGGGGTAGALLYVRIGYNTLLLPATLTGLVGLAYGIYRHQIRGRTGSES